MKTTSVHVLLLLGTAIGLFSCRKETPAGFNTRLLTEKSWSYDEFGIDQNLDGNIDVPNNFQTCALDDLVKFNEGGTGSLDQGGDLCYPEFPQSQPFEWSLQNNDTQIEYGGALHTILALDENQLAIYTEENSGSGTVRHILIYKH
jgi:hypothetical protein